MKVALIIGHNKRARGAYSQILGREYDYWKGIAEKIKTEIPELVDVYERKPNEYYTREMFEVLEELNKNNHKFCIELHFNAAESEQANGSKIRTKENILKETEVVNGKEKTVEKKETTRGLILVQDSKTRGAYGICKSKDTYILVEPFFGSNNEESLKFSVESDVVNLFVDFIKEM